MRTWRQLLSRSQSLEAQFVPIMGMGERMIVLRTLGSQQMSRFICPVCPGCLRALRRRPTAHGVWLQHTAISTNCKRKCLLWAKLTCLKTTYGLEILTSTQGYKNKYS